MSKSLYVYVLGAYLQIVGWGVQVQKQNIYTCMDVVSLIPP